MTILFHDDGIIINNENLTSEKLRLIAGQLSNNKKIQKMIINNSKFMEGSTESFCENIDFDNRDSVKIMFEFNNSSLSEKNVLDLSLYFQYFTKLHFKNASLNDRSIKVISEYISKNPMNITTLHLEDNRFGVDAHLALITALSKNTQIDKVFLRNTHKLKSRENYRSVYHHLSALLEVTNSIRVIGIQESVVNFSFVRILTEGLSKNKSLHNIDFGNNVFEEDETGEYSQMIAKAIFEQGLINQFDNYVRSIDRSRNINKIATIIKKRQQVRDEFFRAIQCCDLEGINTILVEKKANIHWTTNDKHYNALHLLALSNSPLTRVKSVIELLYRHHFKSLLHKRCGRLGQSVQPMDLAMKVGRNDIAELMSIMKGAQERLPQQPALSKIPTRVVGPTYQACRFFTKFLSDTAEFPPLVSELVGEKGL